MTGGHIAPQEVERRLPSLGYIDDDAVRSETKRISRKAPEYFWIRPGSRRHHNVHEHGLWKHTLKLSVVIDRLADSWVQLSYVEEDDINHAHAAAILHDQRKEGTNGGGTAKDHDLQMAAVVRDFSSLDNEVADAISAHMGPWYQGPSPTAGSLESLVHVADMIASTKAINIQLPQPVPSELQPYAEGVVEIQ